MMNAIGDLVQTLMKMQWSDYLDILLVAYLIFRLMPMLRSPHVLRIVRAAVALVLVAWLTGALRLHTMNWIMNQFLAVGLLAFVVLFQPELRRMLDHLGNMKLTRFFGVEKPMQEMDQMISQTVMACEIMSRERTGALIVFSREQRLEEFFKTGTKIDALVSEQLLRNLFFTKASLHDGAVVIQDGRIAAAGCVLPLSVNPWLSADMGTRHRAGLGITEVSDAVTVIVSEETGTISVAVNGMLKRHLTPQTLEKELQKDLCPKPEDGSGKKNRKAFKKLTRKDEEADDHGNK